MAIYIVSVQYVDVFLPYMIPLTLFMVLRFRNPSKSREEFSSLAPSKGVDPPPPLTEWILRRF